MLGNMNEIILALSYFLHFFYYATLKHYEESILTESPIFQQIVSSTPMPEIKQECPIECPQGPAGEQGPPGRPGQPGIDVCYLCMFAFSAFVNLSAI